MSEPVGEDFDKRFLTKNITYKATERYSYGWTEYRMNSALAREEVNLWLPSEDRALIDFIELVQGDEQ